MSASEIAIRVEGLGKMYRLGRQRPHASTLSGKIRNAVTSPFQWLSEQMREPTEEEVLWALKDVSFEVKRGEVVGFIGHNGAGKSTLLKLLSRITEPTTGHAEIHGRIAALLEVGTGMHPELTGRENIYMNGTVLGMKKREIDSKFDEIVDFSGIAKFLDTPVKRYSSGMRVRLGFAIAAHLEPEILVVDEVLAVGDADFQAKCLGKMQDVAHGGRTVLFVSHNMGAIQSLCQRTIVLDRGMVRIDGETRNCITHYMNVATEKHIDVSMYFKNRGPSGPFFFINFYIEDSEGVRVPRLMSGETYSFCFVVRRAKESQWHHVKVSFYIIQEGGAALSFICSSYSNEFRVNDAESFEVEFRCNMPKFPFIEGRYHITAVVSYENMTSDRATHFKQY